jgi:hypothetical protein
LKKEKTTAKQSRICKIVYFDEDSVTDYIQIVAGGRLEKTTELLNQTKDSGDAGVSTKASIGFGGILKALMGFDVSASTEASLETSFNTDRMAKNIVKNTILTDFIDILAQNEEAEKKEKKAQGAIHKFEGYTISAPKDSLSYVAIISPYLSMLKGGGGVPAGDFNIAIEKLDNTIKSAKGYYEFVGCKDGQNVIFRFNIKSFKNNYKVIDLLKMDISIYAIKVGTSSIDKLNFNNEFDIQIVTKDNPTYQKKDKKASDEDTKAEVQLDVYDVILAGVESSD